MTRRSNREREESRELWGACAFGAALILIPWLFALVAAILGLH